MGILTTILAIAKSPFTGIAKAYIQGRNNVKLRELEEETERTFLSNQLTEAFLEDDYRRAAMAEAIIRRDRGDWKTSWIRPVTAGLALLFWVALTLSQIRLGGNGLLPIVWDIPPAGLGQIFIAFPMGVLATFYIARPFEKFFMNRKGI